MGCCLTASCALKYSILEGRRDSYEHKEAKSTQMTATGFVLILTEGTEQ